MASQQEVAEKLESNIWRTAGARFNAARRFQWRERLSVASISGFAVCGIGISILPSVAGLPSGGKQFGLYAFIGVAISLSILIISLLEGAGRFLIRAEKLHDNAREIAGLKQKLSLVLAKSNFSIEEVEEIRQEYESRIRECPFNHSPVDDNRFAAQHRFSKEFLDTNDKPKVSKPKALLFVLIYWVQPTWIFLIAWSFVIWLLIALYGDISRSLL